MNERESDGNAGDDGCTKSNSQTRLTNQGHKDVERREMRHVEPFRERGEW